MKKKLYPDWTEEQRDAYYRSVPKLNEEPDWTGSGKPNYDKFVGWTTEKVLVWLNID